MENSQTLALAPVFEDSRSVPTVGQIWTSRDGSLKTKIVSLRDDGYAILLVLEASAYLRGSSIIREFWQLHANYSCEGE